MLTRIALCSSLLTSAVFAQSISITAPTASQVVTGSLTFTSTVTSAPTTARVEYVVDGNVLAFATSFPWSASWNTALYHDSTHTVVARAKNALGNVVATSTAVTFSVANRTWGMVYNSPSLASALSGSVTFSVTKSGPAVDGWLWVIDGKADDQYSSSSTNTYNLDTTTLPDGEHDLTVTVYAGASPNRAVSMIHRKFTTNNTDSTLREIRASKKQVVLAPAATHDLDCYQVTVGGSTSACTSPSFASNNTGVATVNSSTGVVTAVGNGAAKITTTAHGKTAETFIRVRTGTAYVAHFALNGDILTSYTAGQSRYLANIFHLEYDSVQPSSTLLAEVKAAKFAIQDGMFENPADNAALTSFATWQTSWDNRYGPRIAFAATHGLPMFFHGDDIARNANEMNWSITGSFATQAIQYAMHTLKQSGRAMAIDMVDEVTSFWGNDPFPGGNPWSGKSPSIPNTAFTALMSRITGSASRPPIAWPVLGDAGAVPLTNWSQSGIADYASVFWNVQDWRRAFAWGQSNRQTLDHKSTIIWNAYVAGMRQTIPMISQVGATGAFYTKYTASPNPAEYNPPTDEMREPPSDPDSIITSAMVGVAMGDAGFRVYGFDFSNWITERGNSETGPTIERQTGSSPLRDTDSKRRWYAAATASQVIDRLAPWLLTAHLDSPDYGTGMLSASRQGTAGRAHMIINGNDAPRTETVDFSGLTYGTVITRYIVDGSGVRITSASGSSESLTLQGGQTAIYIFPATTADAIPVTRISFRLANVAGVSAVAITSAYGSSFLLDYATPVECTADCSITLDRALSNATYYRYRYLDASGAVLATSNLHTLLP